MADEITYNLDVKLSVPDGIALDSVTVHVEVDPPTSGYLIYGYDASGNIQPVQAQGSGDLKLPYVNGQIYVRYLGDAPAKFSLGVVSYSEPRGQSRPSSVPPGQTRQ